MYNVRLTKLTTIAPLLAAVLRLQNSGLYDSVSFILWYSVHVAFLIIDVAISWT